MNCYRSTEWILYISLLNFCLEIVSLFCLCEFVLSVVANIFRYFLISYLKEYIITVCNEHAGC
jgi:hypothetical protein